MNDKKKDRIKLDSAEAFQKAMKRKELDEDMLYFLSTEKIEEDITKALGGVKPITRKITEYEWMEETKCLEK